MPQDSDAPASGDANQLPDLSSLRRPAALAIAANRPQAISLDLRHAEQDERVGWGGAL